MTWDDAINGYLLRCVRSYGKNWSEIRKILKVLINQFHRDVPKKDFTEQELSIQYKYLIASAIPPESTISYSEEQLLEFAFNEYCQRRVRYIEEQIIELSKIETQQDRDNKLLEEGRYSEISEKGLLFFRKRLRAFGKRDLIGEELNLDPLPANPEEDRKVRAEYRRSKIIGQGLHRGVFDEEGNLWIPVASAEETRNFFKRPRPNDQSHDHLTGALKDKNVLFVEVNNSQDSISLPSPKKILRMDSKHPPQQPIGTPRRLPIIRKSLGVSVGGLVKNVPTIAAASTSIDFADAQVTPLRNQKRLSTTSSSVLKAEHPPSSVTTARSINRSRSRIANQSTPSTDAPAALNTSPHGRWRWRRAVQSLLTPASNHRHSHIFGQPVTDEIAPHYSIMIYSPMDLSTIKRNLDSRLAVAAAEEINNTSPDAIQQTVSSIVKNLLHDLLLMFANARMYNNRDHSIHHIAGTMCSEVLVGINCYCESWPEEIPGLPSVLLSLPTSSLSSPQSTARRRPNTTSSVTSSTPFTVPTPKPESSTLTPSSQSNPNLPSNQCLSTHSSFSAFTS